MTILDTQYERTNNRLMNEAGRALREAAEFTAKLERGLEKDFEIPQGEFNVDPPKKPDMNKPDLSNITQDIDLKDPEVELAGKLEEWMQTFFPSLTNGFQNIPDEWLANVLNGVYPLGMSKEVFNRPWQRARDREEAQRQSDVRQASVELSQRGFTVPPGTFVAAMDRAQQRASQALQEINVEQAVREEETRVQMIQFAAEQAASLRQGLSGQVAQYLSVWASTQRDQTIEKARLRAEAQRTFYDALQSYYGVEAQFAELGFRADELEHNAKLQQQSNRIQLETSKPEVAAMGQAIQGLSQIASSATSAAGSLIAQIEGV